MRKRIYWGGRIVSEIETSPEISIEEMADFLAVLEAVMTKDLKREDVERCGCATCIRVIGFLDHLEARAAAKEKGDFVVTK
jgi:hypothetical protein